MAFTDKSMIMHLNPVSLRCVTEIRRGATEEIAEAAAKMAAAFKTDRVRDRLDRSP
jgi:hypothetical protein